MNHVTVEIRKSGVFEDRRMAGVRLHLEKGKRMELPEEWAAVLVKAGWARYPKAARAAQEGDGGQ